MRFNGRLSELRRVKGLGLLVSSWFDGGCEGRSCGERRGSRVGNVVHAEEAVFGGIAVNAKIERFIDDVYDVKG